MRCPAAIQICCFGKPRGVTLAGQASGLYGQEKWFPWEQHMPVLSVTEPRGRHCMLLSISQQELIDQLPSLPRLHFDIPRGCKRMQCAQKAEDILSNSLPANRKLKSVSKVSGVTCKLQLSPWGFYLGCSEVLTKQMPSDQSIVARVETQQAKQNRLHNQVLLHLWHYCHSLPSCPSCKWKSGSISNSEFWDPSSQPLNWAKKIIIKELQEFQWH